MQKKILAGILAAVMALQSGAFAAAEEQEAIIQEYGAETPSDPEEVFGLAGESAEDIIISEESNETETFGISDNVQETTLINEDTEMQTEGETGEDSDADSAVPEEMIEDIEILEDSDFELIKTAEGGVAVDEANFPDEKFRTAMKKFDKDKNNILSKEEIKAVTKINLEETPVSSLEGIEYFTSLERLNCAYSQLDKLDVSKNTALTYLYCFNCGLKELDLSKNTALTYLNCRYNRLRSLNLEKNVQLETLYCKDNVFPSVQVYEEDGMWKFDFGEVIGKDNLVNVSDMRIKDTETDLESELFLEDGIVSVPVNEISSMIQAELSYSYDTKAPNLDADFESVTQFSTRFILPLFPLPEGSDLSGIQEVEINEKNFPDEAFRQILKSRYDGNGDGKLDVNELSAITSLSARDVNDLTGIGFFKALMVLDCTSSAEEELDDDDVEYYDGNYLKELDVSENPMLRELYCPRNKITELDVSSNTELTVLDCSDNKMEKLDLSKNKKLKKVICDSNRIKEINVSGSTALTELNCHGCQLEELDVSGNTELAVLDCGRNRLKKIDLSKNAALTKLDCSRCQLEELDVSSNTALTELDCFDCQLEELDVSGNTKLIDLNCNANCLKKLDLGSNTALTILKCSQNKLDELDLSSTTALAVLGCVNNKLNKLDLSKNTALLEIDCRENQLNELNLGEKPELTELDCSENQLSGLDVSKSTALTDLDCSDNQLEELDVSSNLALTRLKCSGNNLKKLDVSKNTELETLGCGGNKLGGVNLEENAKLKNFYYSSKSKKLPAKVSKKDGIWQLDLSDIVDSQNMDRVRLGSEGAVLSGGIVKFQGAEMPTEFAYFYNTKAAGLRDGNPTMEVLCVLERDTSSDCAEHDFGEYVVTKEATVLEEGTQVCTCSVCGYEQSVSIPKLVPTVTLNAEKIVLKVKTSTSKLKVSDLAKGDYVKSWKSSNQKIVKVDKNGKIAAQKETGTAKVTITLASGLQKEIPVKVQKSDVKTTKISGLKKKLTLKEGKTAVLQPVIVPITSQDKVVYKSLNEGIAGVNAKGVVEAKKKGKTKITVISGKQKFTMTVIVKK